MAKICGSLIDFSGFNFEHINGQLVRLFKGNKRFDMQISRKIDAIINLNDINNSSDRGLFIKNLFYPRTWKETFLVGENIKICGKY